MAKFRKKLRYNSPPRKPFKPERRRWFGKVIDRLIIPPELEAAFGRMAEQMAIARFHELVRAWNVVAAPQPPLPVPSIITLRRSIVRARGVRWVGDEPKPEQVPFIIGTLDGSEPQPPALQPMCGLELRELTATEHMLPTIFARALDVQGGFTAPMAVPPDIILEQFLPYRLPPSQTLVAFYDFETVRRRNAWSARCAVRGLPHETRLGEWGSWASDHYGRHRQNFPITMWDVLP